MTRLGRPTDGGVAHCTDLNGVAVKSRLCGEVPSPVRRRNGVNRCLRVSERETL